ncbi:MAG: hypothetical protein ACRCYC_09045 [Paraclostridium sp.]|uniref:hypothetical protein n=1 Tax=Paraclostridium sp. TaxID=2023273 RepID=UPI003F2FE575
MMEQFEYKFLKLSGVAIKEGLFSKGKDINDIRIPRLENEFNIIGKDGWKLIEISWIEGIAIFIRKIK